MIKRNLLLHVSILFFFLNPDLHGQQSHGHATYNFKPRVSACTKITQAGMHYLHALKNGIVGLKKYSAALSSAILQTISTKPKLAQISKKTGEFVENNRLLINALSAGATVSALYFLTNDTDAFYLLLPTINWLMSQFNNQERPWESLIENIEVQPIVFNQFGGTSRLLLFMAYFSQRGYLFAFHTNPNAPRTYFNENAFKASQGLVLWVYGLGICLSSKTTADFTIAPAIIMLEVYNLCGKLLFHIEELRRLERLITIRPTANGQLPDIDTCLDNSYLEKNSLCKKHLLFWSRVNVNHRKERTGLSLLQLAVRTNQCDLTQDLLTRGAIVDLAQDHQKTPLAQAVEHNRFDLVKQLLHYGASPNHIIPGTDITIFNYAKQYRQEICELFQKRFDDIAQILKSFLGTKDVSHIVIDYM